MSQGVDDPYSDPATGVLRNLLGISSREELDRAEAALSVHRLAELATQYPIAPTGDLDELRAIHRHLFQDVYEWAGQVRTVELAKNDPAADSFMPASLIGRAAGFAAEELRADNALRGMPRERFVERLAHHYEQFNYVHPFREGNGRTQRVMWDRVARDAGWQLNWRKVTGATNDAACRAAAKDRDFGPLRAMFDRITTAAAGPDARAAADLGRLSFARPSRDATRPSTARPRPPRQPPGALPDRPAPGIGD